MLPGGPVKDLKGAVRGAFLTSPRGAVSLRSMTGEKRDRCSFLSSYGGVYRCQDPAYFLGLCEFHYHAYERGEINRLGHISDKLDDQVRRREINFHGLVIPEDLKPSF